MKNGMKRLALLCMALVPLAGSVSACQKRSQVVNYEVPKEAEHTLSFFGNKYEAVNVEVIEEIINGYMDQNPDVSVTYESEKGAAYFDSLRNRQQTDHLDDIFIVNHDTTLEFAADGSLADLSELVKYVPFSEDMVRQMTSADGKIYWVPTTISAFGLYCNLDLLHAHGCSVPRTLGEWKDVCDFFVKKGITPIVANNDISLKTLAVAVGFYPLYEKGMQEETFAKINRGEETLSKYLLDGFTLIREFCDRGYIDPSEALKTEKTSDDLEIFVQGEAPFMLTGVWAAERVRRMNPDFSWRVVSYPVLEEGAVLVINPDVRLSIAANGENQELAKDFADYFLKSENLWRFADHQASFCPLADGYEPSMAEIQEIAGSYKKRVSVIGADSQMQFPIWDILTETSQRLLAGQQLEELMEWMDAQVVER